MCSRLAEEAVNLSLGGQRISYYPAGLYFDCSATSYVLIFLFWSGDQLQYLCRSTTFMQHWQKPQNKINAGVCAPPWVSVGGLVPLNSFSSCLEGWPWHKSAAEGVYSLSLGDVILHDSNYHLKPFCPLSSVPTGNQPFLHSIFTVLQGAVAWVIPQPPHAAQVTAEHTRTVLWKPPWIREQQ